MTRVVGRLADHPAEADRLLPVLAVAVRSLRGPEFRSGLAGVVRLVEAQPGLAPVIRRTVPGTGVVRREETIAGADRAETAML